MQPRSRERIEIDRHREPLLIPGRLLNEMYAHALEALPEECCGLVSGTRARGFTSVFRCRNTMTELHRKFPDRYPRDGTKAYFMDYQEALGGIERRGEEVLAVYHSHVAAGAYLSEMDQDFAAHELFPFPAAAQIVLAVAASNVRQVVEAGIFEVERGAFRGRPLGALADDDESAETAGTSA